MTKKPVNDKQPFNSAPRPLGLDRVRASGDLGHRLQRNFDRLEEAPYRPPDIFKGEDYSWPADMEGRTILGLTLLTRATGRQPRYLDAILDGLPEHCNERGYMGRVLEPGLCDEQQLSGHGWLLRGLCEHHALTGSPASLERIRAIVRNLLLPARGRYRRYPSRPEQRSRSGGAIGALKADRVNDWYVSTDTGCAFIALDGASHAWQTEPGPELGELVEEMAAAYIAIDFADLSCQTHATLSGLRGLLRYCETAQRPDLLPHAERIWDLYLREGMTENHANVNWFGRSGWTEPCAIVDSFMVAVALWRLTRNPRRLTEAHDIYFNALGHAQRPNGGFGCDTCVVGDTLALASASDELHEAWWCCTMRGAEGLARAVESAAFIDGEDLVMPFYFDGELELPGPGGAATLAVKTEYPYQGNVEVAVSAPAPAPAAGRVQPLRLFIPAWADPAEIRLDLNGARGNSELRDGFLHTSLPLEAGARIRLRFDVGLRSVQAVKCRANGGCHTWRHGPLLLGATMGAEPHALAPDTRFEPAEARAHYISPETGLKLAPVNDMLYLDTDVARTIRRQVCFPE